MKRLFTRKKQLLRVYLIPFAAFIRRPLDLYGGVEVLIDVFFCG